MGNIAFETEPDGRLSEAEALRLVEWGAREGFLRSHPVFA